VLNLDDGLDAMLGQIIEAALEAEDGNKARAAARLKVSLRTVQRHVASGLIHTGAREPRIRQLVAASVGQGSSSGRRNPNRAALWTCVFMVYFTAQGVSPVAFFAGGYEPYDPALAQWKELSRDEHSGLVREQRLLLPNGDGGASYLELQIRHRDPATRRIEVVEPPRRIPRRRVGRNNTT